MFGGSRVYHRLAAAMGDVGFIDIHLAAWVYGSGFPKSLDVGKSIDKQAGAVREVVGMAKGIGANSGESRYNWNNPDDKEDRTQYAITKASTPEAAAWEGWGTAMKPAWEPVIIGVEHT